MENKTKLWVSISALLEGTQSVEEEQLVENWMFEDEKNRKFVRKLKETSFSADLEHKAEDSQERIYLRTREKIRNVKQKRELRIWQSVAAAAIAILFVISGLYISQNINDASIIYAESKSPMGSATQLILNDGTLVELNAGSSIIYPSSFVGKNRTVSLIGEAYFEVAEDAKHPFIVETNGMKVQALGTHFNVKAYDDDNKMITTLMEGSVSVEICVKGQPILLMPNQQVIYDKTTRRAEIVKVNASFYASWKDGECFFENERLADIAKILERQFGTRITVISPELKNQFFSGYFTKQEGLFHILNSFKQKRNVDYRQNEFGIEIYEKK